MVDCSLARHQVAPSADAQGRWFEYFIFNGNVYSNQIPGPAQYTRTPPSEVLANWGVCTPPTNTNVSSQTTAETVQPSNQLDANLMRLRADYEAQRSLSSGMGGDGVGWIIVLAGGVWLMQHATKFVDARTAKRVDADLTQEYERLRQAAPAAALVGVPSHTAETHEVTSGDSPPVTAGDRSPVTAPVTAGDGVTEEPEQGPTYYVNGWTLAQFKAEFCPDGGRFKVDKLHDPEYSDLASSKVFYFLRTFGFAPVEFCVWFVFGIGKKGGDSPSAQRYQVAANFCDRIFQQWRQPF